MAGTVVGLVVCIPDENGNLPPPRQLIINSEESSKDERTSSAVEGIFSPRPTNVTAASDGHKRCLIGPVLSSNLDELSPEMRINIDDLYVMFVEIVEKSNMIISRLEEEDEYEEDEWETSSDTCFHLDISENYPHSPPHPPIKRSKSNPSFTRARSYFRELIDKDKEELQDLTELFLMESSTFLSSCNDINEIGIVKFFVNGIDSLIKESFKDLEFLEICLGGVINHLKSITSNEGNDEFSFNDRENPDKLEKFHVAPNTPALSESSESSSDDSSLSEDGSFFDATITTVQKSAKALFNNNS